MIVSTTRQRLSSAWNRKPRDIADLLAILTVAYCAALPFDIVPGAFGRSLAFPLLGAVLIVWAIGVARGGIVATIDRRLLAVAAIFVAWCTTTILWSVAPEVTFVSSISHILQILTIMALSVSIPSRTLPALEALVHGTVLMSLLVLLGTPDPTRGGRTSIFGVDENITGMVLAIGFAAAISSAIGLGRRLALFFLIEAGVIAGAILKGGSRSAFVAAALVLLVTTIFLVFRSKRVGWRISAGLLVLSLVVPALLFVLLQTLGLVPDRIREFVSAPLQQDDSMRGEIVDQYTSTMGEWWLQGVGFGADNEYLITTGLGTQNVHQMFWRVWVEVGIVGLLLFCALLIGVVLATIKRRTDLIQAILLGVPVAFFALTLGGTDRTTIFWFVVAFAAAGTGPPIVRRPPSHVMTRIKSRSA